MSLENNREENNREGTIRFPNWVDNNKGEQWEKGDNREMAHWCPRSGQVMGNSQVTKEIM